MLHLYRIYATYQVLNEYETFYQTMPSEEHLQYFEKAIPSIKETFYADLDIVAASSLDLVDGFDFKDEELLSVIGKKDMKDPEEMYKDILELVRNNPLNSKPVPKGFNRYMRPVIIGKL